MSVYSIGDKQPQLADPVWIAPNAVVIGNVRLGRNVGIWWNAVLRGDNDPITIGDDTNIQDGSLLHTDVGVPLTVGSGVTVGHGVTLHGCTIGDGSLIGMGAILLNGCVIGRECLIGAGALIPERKEIPDRSLVIGSPGRVVRQLTDQELAGLRASARHYVEHWRHYATALKQIA